MLYAINNQMIVCDYYCMSIVNIPELSNFNFQKYNLTKEESFSKLLSFKYNLVLKK